MTTNYRIIDRLLKREIVLLMSDFNAIKVYVLSVVDTFATLCYFVAVPVNSVSAYSIVIITMVCHGPI